MRLSFVNILMVAALVVGAGSLTQAQIRLGDQLGGPSRGPLAGLEGDSQFSDPVTLSAQFTAPTAERPAVLMITAEIAPGWHVYSLTQPPGGPTKTKIELNDSTQFKLIGQFRSQPEPTERVDDQAWVGLTIEEHEGQVTWYAPIELTAGVDPASLAITGKVRMLACKESCIPVNQDFTARLGRRPVRRARFSERARHEQRCGLSHRPRLTRHHLPIRRLRGQNLGRPRPRRSSIRRR